MTTISDKMIITGILFLLTLFSGVWVSNSGKPINVVIFTIHKLIALGTVVLAIFTIVGLAKSVGINGAQIVAVVFSCLFVISLFVTGAFLSAGKPVHEIVLTIHRIAPFLAGISVAMTIYLMANGKG